VSLLKRLYAPSGCRWRRRPPDKEDSGEILNKKKGAHGRVWSFNLGVAPEIKTSDHKDKQILTICHKRPRKWTQFLIGKPVGKRQLGRPRSR
jgi:hypothetical protein